MYRIILGDEDMPTSRNNKIFNRSNYTEKVLSTSILNVNKDKKR